MSVGIWQVLVIAAIALIFFGRGRIAPFMEDLGKGISSFKKGLKDVDADSAESKKKITSDEDKNTK